MVFKGNHFLCIPRMSILYSTAHLFICNRNNPANRFVKCESAKRLLMHKIFYQLFWFIYQIYVHVRYFVPFNWLSKHLISSFEQFLSRNELELLEQRNIEIFSILVFLFLFRFSYFISIFNLLFFYYSR